MQSGSDFPQEAAGGQGQEVNSVDTPQKAGAAPAHCRRVTLPTLKLPAERTSALRPFRVRDVFFCLPLGPCRLNIMKTSAVPYDPTIPQIYTHTSFFLSLSSSSSLPPFSRLKESRGMSLTRRSCFLCEACQQARLYWCHLSLSLSLSAVKISSFG